VAAAVLPAMLVELSFYSSLAFEQVRERCRRLAGAPSERFAWKLPVAMMASALVPYLIYSLPTGAFRAGNFLLLLLLAAVVSWWFGLLGKSRLAAAAFLIFVAAVYLAKLFRGIYPPPVETLRIDILGQLMWIRLSLAALLLIRGADDAGFGFLPTRREWLVGLKHFAAFLPFGIALIYGLGFARFDPAAGWWWKAPLVFIGILWMVALAEEFFFRGLVQRWLIDWLGVTAGIVVTSALFGAVHLPFREFPNWKFAALAAVAGLFYGRACLKGNGIRAAMVTHALVVTLWRTLFR